MPDAIRSLLSALALASLQAPLAAADGTVSAAFDAFGDADIALASTAVALALLLLGLVLTFAGRRFLRASVFVGALIAGGFAMASGVIDAALVNQDSGSFFSSSSSSSSSFIASPVLVALASWVGFFTCGCAAGAIAAGFHQRIANALIGGFAGVVLAFIVHLAWDHFVILAVTLGVALGAVATAWEDPPAAVVIVPTSVAGAALVLLGIAFFTGGFPTTYDLVKFWARAKLRGSWVDAVPASWWRFFAAFLALAVVGVVVHDISVGLDVSDSTLTGVLNAVSGSDTITQGPAIVATAMLLLGGFFALSGFYFVKPIVFIEAFILGGYAFATLVDSALVDWAYAVIASWVSFLIGGIIFGAVVLSVYRVGVALIGAAAGFVLAYIAFIFVGRPLDSNEPITVLVVLCIICGLLGGLATWSGHRFVFIAATSWTGAGLVIYAFGYFAGGFPNALGLKAFWKDQAAGVSWTHAFPGAWWGYLFGFLLLFSASVVTQLHFARVLEARRCEEDGCDTDAHGPECGLEFIVTPPSSFGDGGKPSWSTCGTPSSWREGDRASEAARRAKNASQQGFLV